MPPAKKAVAARKKLESTRKRVAVLVENIYEDLELWYPVLRLREAGVEVVIVGPEKGVVYQSKHGYPATSEADVSSVKAAQFDGIIVPGGYAPDKMRRNAKMVALVRDIFQRGGVVASICHGPWMLAEADIMRGRRFTCVRAIKTDIVNAGGVYLDEEVVVDGNLVTSRIPPDLPAMMKAVLQLLGI